MLCTLTSENLKMLSLVTQRERQTYKDRRKTDRHQSLFGRLCVADAFPLVRRAVWQRILYDLSETITWAVVGTHSTMDEQEN